MGRGNHNQSKDNNESQLPQTPRYDIKQPGSSDTELAREMGDLYEVERKPGMPATGVRRKK